MCKVSIVEEMIGSEKSILYYSAACQIKIFKLVSVDEHANINVIWPWGYKTFFHAELN